MFSFEIVRMKLSILHPVATRMCSWKEMTDGNNGLLQVCESLTITPLLFLPVLSSASSLLFITLIQVCETSLIYDTYCQRRHRQIVIIVVIVIVKIVIVVIIIVIVIVIVVIVIITTSPRSSSSLFTTPIQVCERRVRGVANRRDEAATMRNLINFESQTPTDCFLYQSRDGAGKRHLSASPINTPPISRASPLYNHRTPLHVRNRVKFRVKRIR